MATPDEMDERALVTAAQTEPARFLDLYDRHFHHVYAYVLRRTGNRAETEDVTSEVFHRALVNLRGYEWRGVPFVAWLYRIAAHELADRRRSAAREAVTQPPDLETSAPDFERRVMLFQLVDRLPADRHPHTSRRLRPVESDVRATACRNAARACKALIRRAAEASRRSGRHDTTCES